MDDLSKIDGIDDTMKEKIRRGAGIKDGSSEG
jgi:hypothetical protein